MKKQYTAPATQVNETQVCHMLAESLNIYDDTTVSGADALSRDTEDWNIWDE